MGKHKGQAQPSAKAFLAASKEVEKASDDAELESPEGSEAQKASQSEVEEKPKKSSVDLSQIAGKYRKFIK